MGADLDVRVVPAAMVSSPEEALVCAKAMVEAELDWDWAEAFPYDPEVDSPWGEPPPREHNSYSGVLDNKWEVIEFGPPPEGTTQADHVHDCLWSGAGVLDKTSPLAGVFKNKEGHWVVFGWCNA